MKISKNTKIIIACCVVAVVVCIFLSIFRIVPTGYTGVKTTFGQVSNDNISSGLVIKVPFVQSVELICNKQQDKSIKTEIWGETAEKTPVSVSNIIITYRISPEKSSWLLANVKNGDDLVDESVVTSALKSAMVRLEVNEVTDRSKIEPLTKEMLSKSLDEKYGENAVTILKVVINQMDFEESYNEAIAKKSIAIQEYEKQVIENKKAIEKAEADKAVSIKKAQAKAEAKLIEAEAEAKANEKISKSMNENILKSKFYDKWNGELPNVMSDDTVITDIR